MQSSYRKRKLPARRVIAELLESRVLLSASSWTQASAQWIQRDSSLSASPSGSSVPTATPNYLALAGSVAPFAIAPPGSAYAPSQIRRAYGIDQVMFGGVQGDGAGQTIAIIDAYHAPTAYNDLQSFDHQFGLPDLTLYNTSSPPTTPWFRQVAQDGSSNYPPTDPQSGSGGTWALEAALDVQWVHAIAPAANIILVEAINNSFNSLIQGAVNWARNQLGVSAISMSFGGNEFSSEANYDTYFTTPVGHQGVTFVASTGDDGQPGGYPAFSPNVVAVGGTNLTLSGGNYGGETGWGGSGGGISAYEIQPAFQKSVVTQSTTRRTTPDLSLDADPNSGVAVYDSYDYPSSPWLQVGGTSLAAPLFAAMVAITDQGQTLYGAGTFDGKTQTLPRIYALPSSDFHDVVSGSNGFLAGTGYDLITGRGSPAAPSFISDIIHLSNHPPAGADKILSISQNAPYVFTASDFGFSDSNDLPANALLALKISTLPTAGSLSDNGLTLTAGMFVPVADINAGKFLFTPAPGATGSPYASFTFQLQDDGGTANGGVNLDPTPNLLTFNVISAPSASLANGSFETPAVVNFAYDPSGTVWTFTGGAGIQTNGGDWGAPSAPDGSQTAFLQSSGAQIAQSFSVPGDVPYHLDFQAALRSYRGPGAARQQITLLVDGISMGDFSPLSASQWTGYSVPLTAGTHTIIFRSVNAGDTSAFLDNVNLAPVALPSGVTDGSFEVPAVNDFAYGPAGSAWTFTGSAGVQANGGAWGAPRATDGSQTAFLQGGSQISQTIAVAGGAYTLQFNAALRGFKSPGASNQQLGLYVDGSLVQVFQPTSKSSWDTFTASLNLSAGNHTISFQGLITNGDTSAFIDNVKLL